MAIRMTPEEYRAFLKKANLSRNKKAAEEMMSQLPPMESLPPKYWNVKVYVYEDGTVDENKSLTGHGKVKEKYDSRREYFRSIELGLLQRAGRISGLSRQKRLEIQPSFMSGKERVHAIFYVADFFYKTQDGKDVVEDVKGFDVKTGKYRSTEAFRIKWKLLKYKYPQYVFVLY